MAEKKVFYSINEKREKTIKIRRSVFMCSMEHVTESAQAKAFIRNISKENQTASHNCWAYIVGDSGELFHSSDAGEPSGTAGKPMLNTLQSYKMTNVAAVVTRHFGGVKLGVKGLIEAYSDSVDAAINMEALVKLVKTTRMEIQSSYEFNNTLLARLEPFNTAIVNSEYSDQVMHLIEVENEQLDQVTRLLSDYQNQGQIQFKDKAS